MAAYYNEIDKFAAQWLRELIKVGLIPDGVVDERSIEDVRPDELSEYTQCHFFAGIGGWAYALRLAGWPDDRPVWTGSCPCQPFSNAGKRKGFADERHLWPAFFWHIRQQRPVTVFGEQVESKDGRAWLDTVQLDMEGAGYAVGACASPAAGYGAPHIRQRLYWVADTQKHDGRQGFFRKLDHPGGTGLERHAGHGGGKNRWPKQAGSAPQAGRSRGLEIATAYRRRGGSNGDTTRMFGEVQAEGRSPVDELEDTESYRMEDKPKGKSLTGKTDRQGIYGFGGSIQTSDPPYPTNGFWANPDWLWCRDKKWRPVKSGLVPLADGVSNGVGCLRDKRLCFNQRLKGYGNAIVIPQAVEFIKAYMELKEM